MGERLVELLSAWSVERRGWVLSICLIVSIVFASGLPWLRVDTSPDALVSSVEGHADVESSFREKFGGAPSRLLVLLQGDEILGGEGLRYQMELARDLSELPAVERVEGVASILFPGTRAPLEKELLSEESVRIALDRAPWVVPVFLSKDHHLVCLFVDFDDQAVHDQETRKWALSEVRMALEKVKRPDKVSVRLAGVPILREAILEKLEKDRLTLNPAMMLVCLLVLAFTFRWWPAVVAPLCAVGIAALGVMGGLSFLKIPLTILTNIIPPLLIIVGLSDSVHLLGRYDEELRLLGRHPDRILAGRRAARAMLVACFLTSLTTAVGFGSLAAAETEELGRFGLAAAAGVILAYFSTVLFVPAFVTLVERPRPSKGEHTVGLLERAVFQVTRRVLHHAQWVGILALGTTIALVALAGHVTADARLLDAFDEEEPVAELTRELEENLVGIRPLEIMIEGNDVLDSALGEHLGKVAKWLEDRPDVIESTGFFEVVPNDPDARASLGRYAKWITPDGKFARMTVFFKDSGIVSTLATLDELKLRLSEGAGGAFRYSFTGEAYTGSVGRSSVLRDLVLGLGFALLTIFLLLGLLFRSARLALATVPPNVIPLLATGAYMTLRGIHLNMATVITFSIGIGLAVDDSVHVVARFREESARLSSVRVALLRAARGTGRAIVVTAVSLSLGFSVLLFSEFVSVRQFGELIAFTVLACLVSALLVQPALLLLVAPKRKLLVSPDS